MIDKDDNSRIHPTAVIDPRAEIHPKAEIGPYVIIDGPVVIGRATRVLAHAYLTGWTEIGEDNVIHMGAVIGHEPQDREYRGARTYLRIGDRNIIREHAEIHRGTKPESSTISSALVTFRLISSFEIFRTWRGNDRFSRTVICGKRA